MKNEKNNNSGKKPAARKILHAPSEQDKFNSVATAQPDTMSVVDNVVEQVASSIDADPRGDGKGISPDIYVLQDSTEYSIYNDGTWPYKWAGGVEYDGLEEVPANSTTASTLAKFDSVLASTANQAGGIQNAGKPVSTVYDRQDNRGDADTEIYPAFQGQVDAVVADKGDGGICLARMNEDGVMEPGGYTIDNGVITATNTSLAPAIEQLDPDKVYTVNNNGKASYVEEEEIVELPLDGPCAEGFSEHAKRNEATGAFQGTECVANTVIPLAPNRTTNGTIFVYEGEEGEPVISSNFREVLTDGPCAVEEGETKTDTEVFLRDSDGSFIGTECVANTECVSTGTSFDGPCAEGEEEHVLRDTGGELIGSECREPSKRWEGVAIVGAGALVLAGVAAVGGWLYGRNSSQRQENANDLAKAMEEGKGPVANSTGDHNVASLMKGLEGGPDAPPGINRGALNRQNGAVDGANDLSSLASSSGFAVAAEDIVVGMDETPQPASVVGSSSSDSAVFDVSGVSSQPAVAAGSAAASGAVSVDDVGGMGSDAAAANGAGQSDKPAAVDGGFVSSELSRSGSASRLSADGGASHHSAGGGR